MLHESLNEVLIDCVRAAGGSKVVGVAIWPSKGVEGGRTRLLACLNPDRSEKLSPEEVTLVARLAREKGCHLYAEWIAHDLGYARPSPVDPDDELAELLRKHNEVTAQHVASSQRLARLLESKGGLRSVA